MTSTEEKCSCPVTMDQFNELMEEMKQLRITVSQLQATNVHLMGELAAKENEHKEDLDNDDQTLNESCATIAAEEDLSVQKKFVIYDLPQFSGIIEEWPLFAESFKETTKIFKYNDRINLMRLQKALIGPAKEAVAALLVHPKNVKNVIDELEFRFGRSELIVRDQINKLHELSDINIANTEQVMAFSSKIRNVVALLSTDKSSHHLSNTSLLEEVVAKLPLDQQLEWSKHAVKIKPYATLEHFSSWMSELARVISVMPLHINKKEKSNKPRQVMYVSKDDKVHLCYVCKKDHEFAHCPDYLSGSYQERWNKVKALAVCFGCLQKGHNLAKCLLKRVCGQNGCQKFHHHSLHNDKGYEQQQGAMNHQESQPIMMNCRSGLGELFKILPVTIFGPNARINTFAMMDEGSSVSLLDESVGKQLGLSGHSQPLILKWFGDRTTVEPSTKVSFEIQGKLGRYQMKNVQTVKHLDLPLQSFKKSEFGHLKHLNILDYSNAKPMLLLGLDHAHLGIPNDMVVRDPSEPIAADTKLGWVVYGPVCRTNDVISCPVVLNTQKVTSMKDLHGLVEEYYNTDTFGVNNIETDVESIEDKAARNILTSTVKQIGNRYEIGLLWKQKSSCLPPSIDMAQSRFEHLEKRMCREPEFAKQYREEMKKFFDKGYARVLAPNELNTNKTKVWYLPHFAVFNVNKPGKMRLVFDAASSTNGTSLNEKLLKGPDQPKSIFDILMKFRQHRVGVAADIREMFLQIKVRTEDQQAQRFLWRDSPEEELTHCVMSSLIFGAVCSPCCAEFVKNHNAQRYINEYPLASKVIIENHYVDDFVASFPTESEAIKVCQQVVEIHSYAGFELRDFVSNSQLLQNVMNKFENNPTCLVNMEYQVTTEKILGLFWNTVDDVFEFHTKFNRVPKQVLNFERSPTKRELLSIVMSIYDPFGFIADFVLHSKIMIQELWKCETKWDEPVPEKIHRRWVEWWTEFANITCLKIQRSYSVHLVPKSTIELHVMVDASQSAFAAVGYFRIVTNDYTEVAFVIGKTKVAPAKLMSVPRLELQAAVLGVRLGKNIIQGHDLRIDKTIYWSDSRTVLYWINSHKRKYKAFVGHRITEIVTISHPHQWRWLPTNLNSSDAATRHDQLPKFSQQNKWRQGPEFLRYSEEHWPAVEIKAPPDILEEEVSACYVSQKQVSMIEELSQNISSYLKLKRVVAWILRAAASFRKQNAPSDDRHRTNILSANEIIEAERAICQMAQRDSFASEIKNLTDLKPISKQSPIAALSPYLDELGILRIKGRIDYAVCLPVDARRPILLPKEHIVTQRIVNHYHQLLHHQNFAATVNEIRQRYWIPNLKSILRRVQRECGECRIKKVQPIPPLMGQLPSDRVTPYVRPFSYTGVDLFGPILVTVGRQHHKKWAVIFTCLTVRAVHFELAEDLSTDAFLICLRNFINRRGTPVRIRCDNGTNFIGAQRELKQAERLLDVDRISDEAANRNIEWVFNCPGNPSSGGCWERLIQIVKRLFTQVLKEKTPRTETLRSALIEAENIINSRPLTDIPLASEDANPLTPNDFLLGCANSTQTPQPVDEKLCLRKQWRIAQALKDQFWKRWTLEYLPQLIHRSKWRTSTSPLKVDDVVIVIDPSLARSQWQKGRIVDVFPAKDGHVRIAMVKTATGTFRRPVNRLAPLNIGKPTMALQGEEC